MPRHAKATVRAAAQAASRAAQPPGHPERPLAPHAPHGGPRGWHPLELRAV